jgi:protein SCO1
VLFALAVLGLPAVLMFRDEPAIPPPLLGALPAFNMVSQEGEPVTPAHLLGQVVVLDFIFTRCPDVCPIMTSQMAALQHSLPAQPFGGAPLRLVSVSVDPDHDTPPILKAYAAKFGADLNSWTFLTGTSADVGDLADGLMQALVKTPAGAAGDVPAITHSQRMVLIDATGQVRGFYETDQPGLDALVDALEGIAGE